MWPRILDTLHAEFSDIADPEQFTRIVLRLLLAALLGGVLGFERERHRKAAGLRTHILVSMGAALFVLAPLQAGASPGELARVIQGIVAGIGFLGAGTIIKHRADDHVHGLTTAAGVWMTAAIGMSCGLGRETTAVLATLFGWVVLRLLPHTDRP
jgi:putative Mg2+ transporter-C (MgtC) family protein